MVPTYANSIMACVENTFLCSFRSQPTAYIRKIDFANFASWHTYNLTKNTLIKHPSICFKHEYSKTAVPILDAPILRQQRNYISRFIQNNTDSHSYLQYTSCRPFAKKCSIFFYQLLRYKGICSDKECFLSTAMN